MINVAIGKVSDRDPWISQRNGVVYDCGTYEQAKRCALDLYADADSPAKLEVYDFRNDSYHVVAQK